MSVGVMALHNNGVDNRVPQLRQTKSESLVLTLLLIITLSYISTDIARFI